MDPSTPETQPGSRKRTRAERRRQAKAQEGRTEVSQTLSSTDGASAASVSTVHVAKTPFDTNKIEITKKGDQYVITNKFHSGLVTAVPVPNADPQTPAYQLTEKYLLYKQLEQMNLSDPRTVENIRKACSSKKPE
jgi:predicted ATP-grasp superfamily ATP-dependent carboligase